MNIYDIIIIGGGISGLYSAYNIQKINPTKKILILESCEKKFIGGRLGNINFHGVTIATGAGIGRKKKDVLLLGLMDELEIPYSEFMVKSVLSQNLNNIQNNTQNNLKKMVLLLKRTYRDNIENKKLTFKEFATKVLGDQEYKKFCLYSGYTDFEKEDFHQTLFNYGLEDNYNEYIGISILWKILIHTLAKKVGWKNIHFSNQVLSIRKNQQTRQKSIDNNNDKELTNIKKNIPNFTIITENNEYLCNKIIVATTIDTVQKLFPKLSIYNKIHGQPFLRIYAKFSKKYIPIIHKYVNITTIVEGPLHKIIPINNEKGIYMIAYTDNQDAILLYSNINKLNYFCQLIKKAVNIPIEVKIEIEDLIYFYWNIGTHYYEPFTNYKKNYKNFLKNVQHPYDNVLVVGEMVSNNHGWTEGALNSVEKVLNKKWIGV